MRGSKSWSKAEYEHNYSTVNSELLTSYCTVAIFDVVLAQLLLTTSQCLKCSHEHILRFKTMGGLLIQSLLATQRRIKTATKSAKNNAAPLSCLLSGLMAPHFLLAS